MTMGGGETRYQIVVIPEYDGGVADDARGSGADDQTVRADKVAKANYGDGLIGKGLPLANLRQFLFWFQHEPSVTVYASSFALVV